MATSVRHANMSANLKKIQHWLIRTLGGYPDIHSAIDDIKTKDDRHKILSLAVKKLFNTIGPDDILKETQTGEWKYAGKMLTQGQKDLIVAQATQFMESFLWKVLQDDVSYQANRKMFSTSVTDEQLVNGKFWVYTLDTFRTRLGSLKKQRGSFSTKVVKKLDS